LTYLTTLRARNACNSEAKDELEETRRLVEELGVPSIATLADIRDSTQVDAVVDEVAKTFWRLDILVANAGVCHGWPLTR
jgi:NAD(P)-dependent dehydrogenase (short-subunit alcohol dehydrogenase family)